MSQSSREECDSRSTLRWIISKSGTLPSRSMSAEWVSDEVTMRGLPPLTVLNPLDF